MDFLDPVGLLIITILKIFLWVFYVVVVVIVIVVAVVVVVVIRFVLNICSLGCLIPETE